MAGQTAAEETGGGQLGVQGGGSTETRGPRRDVPPAVPAEEEKPDAEEQK
jgi:hypothetical protein